ATEWMLQAGKVQNLRCALRRLHCALIPADGTFSFWKQVGQATRRRGFAEGRLLREGCLMPAVGGGLCQLSNALYEVALQADLPIVERWGHSSIVPDSAAASGRDATIAWNYIDLRFRPTKDVLIEAFLTSDELVVRLRGRDGHGHEILADELQRSDVILNAARNERNEESPKASHDVSGLGDSSVASSLRMTSILFSRNDKAPHDTKKNSSNSLFTRGDFENARPLLNVQAHSCGSCGNDTCFRHGSFSTTTQGRTAFLVDECWPEFQSFVEQNHQEQDVLALPLDGARWNQSRSRWKTDGFMKVHAATISTLRRSFAARRLGAYGAARLQAQIDGAEKLAAHLSRALTTDVRHVVVAQPLLPFLWRDGHLGGRTFDVLMTRLPLHDLHTRLDDAASRHPERKTLQEFRAPQWLVDAEQSALQTAHVITPHSEIAKLFAGRVTRLKWNVPTQNFVSKNHSRMIAFPGPVAARKGAYEVRAAARELGLKVLLLGSELEEDDFWDGLTVSRDSTDWSEKVAAVVQPALIQDQPRRLLQALAAGVPVISTEPCGLEATEGLTLVPVGDEQALIDALHVVLR
ncbi:MAG: VanW family protein, partial [Abditibacteriaceae bacterium]